MRSHRHRRIVHDLETVLPGSGKSYLRAAARESFLHRNGGNRVVRGVCGSLVIELKAGFVDSRLVENRGFRKPNSLLRVARLVLSRRKRKTAHAGHAARVFELVPSYQRVLWVQGVIDSLAEFRAPIWRGN